MGRVFRFQTRSSDLKQEMKLFAAILFAATTAQRDREREVEVSNDDSYDSYNAGFGGDDAYGGFYDAFADAFGDAGNYGDYGYDNADDATAAPVAVEAGRPVEVVQEDDGKTVFIDGLALPASDPEDGSFNQNCWVARGTSSTAWFTAGGGNGWAQCNGGEHQACVDNMKQNFNPAANAGTNLYDTYAQQQCRPQHLASSTSALFGPRQKKNDSVCFFCIEPCSDDTAMASGTQTQLQDASCVGTSGTASNSMPFTGLDLDLLAATDAGLDKKVYNGVDITSTDSDFFNMNWYSVVSVDLIEGENRDTREVSRIQHYQLSLVNDAAISPF